MSNTQLYYTLVRQFMITFDQKLHRSTSNTPATALELRAKLISEELDEYTEGLKTANKIEMLDGLCDLAYVVAGTLLTCGLSPIPYSARANLNEYSVAPECEEVISECLFSRPCHSRMHKCTNAALIRIDAVAYKDFHFVNAFKCVHENNMNKLWPERPTDPTLLAFPRGNKFLVKNKDGKIIKPPNHQRPDLAKFIK